LPLLQLVRFEELAMKPARAIGFGTALATPPFSQPIGGPNHSEDVMAITWCEAEVRTQSFRTEQHSRALQRLRGKNQIIADLIAGRLPLLDAACRFSALTAEGRGEEAACREVIGWAHLALCDRPEAADAVSARLEGELERHLSRQGEANSSGRRT
jgi:hypothetical protein